MSKVKELLANKNVFTALCIIAIVALFLPIAKVSVAMEIMGVPAGDTRSVSGFAAIGGNLLGYLLIIGPALLIAMNYVKQLEKYKGVLAIVIPLVCIVVMIVMIARAKLVAVSTDNGMFDVDVKTSVGIGAVLAFLAYIVTVVSGAVVYHGITFDKASLEKIKANGADFIGSAQEKIVATVHNVSEHMESVKANTAVNNEQTKTEANKNNHNYDKTEDVLALIEKLSKMKDAGILTEEEFQEKKKQYLEDI